MLHNLNDIPWMVVATHAVKGKLLEMNSKQPRCTIASQDILHEHLVESQLYHWSIQNNNVEIAFCPTQHNAIPCRCLPAN